MLNLDKVTEDLFKEHYKLRCTQILQL